MTSAAPTRPPSTEGPPVTNHLINENDSRRLPSGFDAVVVFTNDAESWFAVEKGEGAEELIARAHSDILFFS